MYSTEDQFVTTGHAARLLGVGQTTVIRWVDAGKLDCRRVGQRRQVSRASIDALLAAATAPVVKDGGK